MVNSVKIVAMNCVKMTLLMNHFSEVWFIVWMLRYDNKNMIDMRKARLTEYGVYEVF